MSKAMMTLLTADMERARPMEAALPTQDSHPTPPIDTELAAVLAHMADELPPIITPEMIAPFRAGVGTDVAEAVKGHPVAHEERRIPGPPGDPDITISILTRQDHVAGGPGLIYLHSGGMVVGDRFTGIEEMIGYVEILDAVVVSLEYRLAPEHPDPAPIEDSYAGLVWTAEHADELGIDPERLMVIGASAGGGLAAGLALLARDRNGPRLAAQCLVYPMLDDRNETASRQQSEVAGVWGKASNDTGWDALLGDRRNSDAVSIYAAPARAADLTNLPPAFIDCGSSELYRDEDVAYAVAIWAQGGQAELHVWPGGFHGFDLMAPKAALSVAMRTTRLNWIRRVLGA